MIATLKKTLSNAVTDITGHWKRPARGKYIPYKEMLNYSIGGMGMEFVFNITGILGIGATNYYLTAVCGIRPMHLQAISVILSVINMLFYVIRGKMVDGTRTRWGRFRP
ncbi:MAG: MFS transporter, partial [Christensenellaceae bacterium]|nr:MFS transporter [Christensenellaceae bacterium]